MVLDVNTDIYGRYIDCRNFENFMYLSLNVNKSLQIVNPFPNLFCHHTVYTMLFIPQQSCL